MLEVLVSMVTSLVVGGGLLLADRAYLARRSPYGRDRMWNGVTLAFALSGLFIPTTFAYGAHVWVTRRGHWALRVLYGLVAATLATGLYVAVGTGVLWLCGVDPAD